MQYPDFQEGWLVLKSSAGERWKGKVVFSPPKERCGKISRLKNELA
jgi:hypothetical protein